ncbi:MAG: FAD-binding oxidoreductase [Brachybacterium sp.]
MTVVPRTDLAPLLHGLRGAVLTPAHPAFTAASRPWNLAIDQDVSAVVTAEDAADIAHLMRCAARHGLPVATQPSGHGATGRTGGGILLRTGRLNAISIDPVARTARIGAGVRSGDLQRAAAVHGLTALPGSSPVVTVTGAALGGGLSWFGRAFGWMADSILAAEVVLADGSSLRVTDSTDPELLWALRGGGGELAVVAALELQLHPAPRVVGGRQLWPAQAAGEVSRAFRTITETAPPELTLWLELLSYPGSSPMIAIDSTFLGEEAAARELLAPTAALPAPLSDTRAPLGVAELGTITAEPTDPGPGCSRAELLTELAESHLDALFTHPIDPLMMVQIRHLGGAFARPSDSPHGPLTEPFGLYLFGVPTSRGSRAAIRARQAQLTAALPTSGRVPLSFLDPSRRLSDALPEPSLRRLRALKSRLDPAGLLHGNVEVRR